MRKLTLSEWAAVGELIAAVAVVISLLFVAYSINRNTEAAYATTENLIFERHAELTNLVMMDATLAGIIVKMREESPKLTEIETVRWEKYQLTMLDIWAMAYMRHNADLLSRDQWESWNGYFTQIFKSGTEKLTEARWREFEFGYDRSFWHHVRLALFNEHNETT